MTSGIPHLLPYRTLRAEGLSRHRIRELVRSGVLMRIRKGTYMRADAPQIAINAAAAGGRLDCVSLLQHLGVFVLETPVLHVQMEHGFTRVAPRSPATVRHWRVCAAAPTEVFVDIVGALLQACRCQTPRAAVATLDSAWHLGFVGEAEIAEVFGRLPARFAALRPLIDPRADSGPETLLRLALRSHGWDFELQVVIGGVGRVDFVVEGWLIIECDSAAHHGGWMERRRDLRRDLAAAALGYTTLRPVAEDIMWHPEAVIAAIRGLLDARAAQGAVRNVGKRRAQTRKNSRRA